MTNLPELFGSLVFGNEAMRTRLPEDAYKALRRTMDQGEPLDIAVAHVVASAMKDWAIEKGVTHYTHWFQPMTGVTAEKHECFLSPDKNGGIVMELSGSELIKGETDASSLPSGGLRATFEARGYTAWDPTSYAFIKDGVLCIPTAFCSYGGEALDKKTPLLRSMAALNCEAIRLLRLFDTPCKHVTATVGLEQEYFIIDRDRYNSRKDLVYTGRTLLGARPPKGQELDDHYYGSIKMRVSAFMKELDEELWKLGVPAKTEHNEGAPAQHELAPVFTTVNVAVDQNQVMMEMMRKVAKRHGLTCLLHEKPFAGINGSGKHNNWSICTDTGINLLEPGDEPFENARFLTFLCAVIRAVDEYADLLRIAVASPGNDHRLGGNEAPPAIISLSVGEELERVLKAIDEGSQYDQTPRGSLKIGVDALPSIPKDTSDRNRTSPFAFTGNKFEFRMLGSAASAADVNTVLNTIVAESLGMFADALENAEDFTAELNVLLRSTVQRHKKILFSGNGYCLDWPREAEARGLPNYPTAVDAIVHLTDDKNLRLFSRYGVLSPAELRSRSEVMLDYYCKQRAIEASTLLEMVRQEIIPAVIGYEAAISGAIAAKAAACPSLKSQAELTLLCRVSDLLDQLALRTQDLEEALEGAQKHACDVLRLARHYRDEVLEAMEALRLVSDRLETLVAKDVWPFPGYGSLLYRV